MNKAGRRVRVLRGDKLPESTGDKLPAGDDSNFSGEILIGLLGKFCYAGEVTEIPPGNNL